MLLNMQLMKRFPGEAGYVKAVISPALCGLANRTLRWRGGTLSWVSEASYSTRNEIPCLADAMLQREKVMQ